MVCCGFFIICLVLWNVVFFSGLVHSGLAVHGGSLRRKGEVPVAFGWWALPLVATVIGDHARGSQGSQQTAAKSLRSAVPADSGRRKRREWYRPQEQVCTQRASQCCQDAVIKRFWFINAFKAGMDWLRNSEPQYRTSFFLYYVNFLCEVKVRNLDDTWFMCHQDFWIIFI